MAAGEPGSLPLEAILSTICGPGQGCGVRGICSFGYEKQFNDNLLQISATSQY